MGLDVIPHGYILKWLDRGCPAYDDRDTRGMSRL